MLINSIRGLVCPGLVFAMFAGGVVAEDGATAYEPLVPHCLLGLVHAPEVHAELKLSAEQVDKLESLFRDIDAQWFPSRILPEEQQRGVIRKLETQVWEWFTEHATADQRKRLQQLEYYAQSGRMVLRSDVARQLGLQPAQQEKLAALARASDEAQTALGRIQFGDPQTKSLQLAASKATRAERDGLTKILRPEQRQKLQPMLGEPFDASALKRVYPLAPELVAVKDWINSPPLTLQDLRGKVVLVHFYAFQCHNCHANFDIYRRWHRELTAKGVVIVGIQTPETKTERDPDAVKAAAAERDLQFPVLVDVDSKNWNAWGNTMWPTVYVVDKRGYLRHWWQGELNWKGATADKTIEDLVETLLAEK